jgi:hypothetical protein
VYSVLRSSVNNASELDLRVELCSSFEVVTVQVAPYISSRCESHSVNESTIGSYGDGHDSVGEKCVLKDLESSRPYAGVQDQKMISHFDSMSYPTLW